MTSPVQRPVFVIILIILAIVARNLELKRAERFHSEIEIQRDNLRARSLCVKRF